jgi:hypothetical protein
MNRNVKKIVIISIYLLILIAFLVFIYFEFKAKPSCFDAVQNQNEEGLDCGGICAEKCALVAQQDLAVQQTGFVPSGVANNYDIYGVISNPNQTLGSSSFNYQFTVRNAAETIITTKNGTGFILPGETKYLVANNQAMQDTPTKVELVISDLQWVEVNDLYERPQLKIVNKNYKEISSGIGFIEATGLLKNESPLDFSLIKLEIILKNDQGRVVALNSTQMNTVQAGENRDFRVFWPNNFPGTVANMEVQSEINVFNSESFVKKYFKSEKFQQY